MDFLSAKKSSALCRMCTLGLLRRRSTIRAKAPRWPKALQVGLGIPGLFLPEGQSDLLVIIAERETFSFLKAFSHFVPWRGENLLIVNRLSHGDELWKLTL